MLYMLRLFYRAAAWLVNSWNRLTFVHKKSAPDISNAQGAFGKGTTNTIVLSYFLNI